MKLTWKTFVFGVASVVALCAASLQTFGQDAAAKFAEWAPKMSPQNFADEAQVREMEAAQQGWMYFCLQDGAKSSELRAETNKLALDALKGDYPVATKAWLLHVLQWVGDDSCVDGLAALLTSDEPRLFDGAARALAQIPTEKALDALKKAQADSKEPKRFDSYIKARSVDLSIGVETELPLALSQISDADFDAYMKGFGTLSLDDQARALGAVRVRKAKNYESLVVSEIEAAPESDEVKRAAVLALETIGSGKNFGVLYDQLSKYDRGLIVRVMKNIVADDFDAAVVDALKKEKDGANLASLAEVVGGRYIVSAVATLLDAAKKDDCPARLQLLAAAERLATKANIADFVDASLAIADRGDRDRAEQIISRLCEGDASPVVAKMNNQNGAQIMLLLGRIGGDAALATIEKALNSGDAQANALAVRALCNWPNAVVWQKLLAAAQDKAYPEQIKIQALRSFIRVVSLPDEQDGIDMSGKDKLANLKKAFELATRDDERNLVLERVGAVREPESVEFALQFVDTDSLKNKAINAVLDLAHQDYLRKQNKDLFLKALDVVLEKGDQGQKDRAGNYKSNIR